MRRSRRAAAPQEDSGNPRERKITRVGQLYQFDNCLESGLFKVERICSGCRCFYESLPLHKRKPICEEALRTRSETHGSKRYECSRPWTKKPDDAKDHNERMMIVAQLDSLELGKRNLQSLIEAGADDTETTAEDNTESTEADEPPTTPPRQPQQPQRPQQPQQPQQPQPQQPAPRVELDDESGAEKVRTITEGDKSMTAQDVTINSNKISFVVEAVPATHAVVPKAHLNKLQKTAKKVRDVQSRFKRKRFPDVAMQTKATIAVALASAPGLALTAAEYLIPTIVSGMLLETGILDCKGYDHEEFAGSFPSEFYYRSLMFDVAAECLLAFGIKLRNKMVFLACDKGNKKGVGHFVKMLAHWDEETQTVDFKCLDMDASEGTTDGCALAIEFSLTKLGGGTALQIKLQGQTTDSGGGGVLDSLAKALFKKGLCRDNYKTAPCCIHCFQLTLSVPTRKVLGEGGLNEQNLMQLLHSACDLQEALDFDEYVEIVKQSNTYVSDFCNQTLDAAETEADRDFEDKMTKVLTFFDRDGIDAMLSNKQTKIKKMPAPVLTRWWYVGKACVFVFLYYVTLLRVTQVAINVYLTAARVNTIASNLQPLMLEQELFSDCALMYCYHESFFNEHMKWLQDSRDLSGMPGFQSHQILLRYCIIQMDLLQIKESVLTNHPGFVEFRKSVEAIMSKELKTIQKQKADQFIGLALASLNEHFIRFAGPQSLPAALLSESPFSTAVARQIHGVAHPLRQSYERFYASTIHGRVIDVVDFERWLGAVVKPDVRQSMDSCDLVAAQAVIGGMDCRDLVGNRLVPACRHLWNMYLPLASHTQGVEAAVKEARLVSTTGRHEQLRSAIAIIRSHLIIGPGDGDLRSMDAKERARLLLGVAERLQDQHNYMVAAIDDHKEQHQAVKRKLKEEHFAADRVGQLKTRVQLEGDNNKKPNALQKNSGVGRTALTMGLVPYSSAQKKKGHLGALKAELNKRGVEYGPTTGFKALLKLLKENEKDRVEGAKSSAQAIKMAKKAFRVLSNADFSDGKN